MMARNASDSSSSGPVTDSAKVAKSVGLRYVTDRMPGITRHKVGAGFSYRHPTRGLIRDRRELDRIKRLAIPPAYRRVWICTDRNGHLQATGIDARGRKQYRYHPAFRSIEEELKFRRLAEFGTALPAIRSQVAQDLSLRGLPKQKVVALLVEFLERSLIRVGNDAYAKQNEHFGLTTVQTRHVRIQGSRVQFEFVGKSGVEHDVEVLDRRLAQVVRQLQDLPGQELFMYHDDNGRARSVSSTDVNEYLHRLGQSRFSAKDFRTWGASVYAIVELANVEPPTAVREYNAAVRIAMKAVSIRLGNTPAICQKCYVHPAVLQAFRSGRLKSELLCSAKPSREVLDRAEHVLLGLIEDYPER
jgi:DNA topoisomerase I